MDKRMLDKCWNIVKKYIGSDLQKPLDSWVRPNDRYGVVEMQNEGQIIFYSWSQSQVESGKGLILCKIHPTPTSTAHYIEYSNGQFLRKGDGQSYNTAKNEGINICTNQSSANAVGSALLPILTRIKAKRVSGIMNKEGEEPLVPKYDRYDDAWYLYIPEGNCTIVAAPDEDYSDRAFVALYKGNWEKGGKLIGGRYVKPEFMNRAEFILNLFDKKGYARTGHSAQSFIMKHTNNSKLLTDRGWIGNFWKIAPKLDNKRWKSF